MLNDPAGSSGVTSVCVGPTGSLHPCPLASHRACRGDKALPCLAGLLERCTSVAVPSVNSISGASPSYPPKMLDGEGFVLFSANP